MKKKIIVSIAAALCLIPLLVALQMLWNINMSRTGVISTGKKIKFESSVAKILSQTDWEMMRDGYIVHQKTVDSYRDNGTIELLPFNGIDMCSLKTVSTYTRPERIISHTETAYQKFLRKMESFCGRLPAFFYALDRVNYEGTTETEVIEVKIEHIFILVDCDRNGKGYKVYSGACKQTDTVKRTKKYIGEEGDEDFDTSVDINIYSSPHYEGDLSWLKEMAYNNYFSPYVIEDAFECTDDLRKQK